MAFNKKTWQDRIVEFPGRRDLKNIATNETTTFDVFRNEGIESQAGDAFSAANMNDLEERIHEEFGLLKGFTPILDPSGKIIGYKTSVGGADTVFPFSGGKDALYQALQYSGFVTADMTFEQMCAVLAAKYPATYDYAIVTPWFVNTAWENYGVTVKIANTGGTLISDATYNGSDIANDRAPVGSFARVTYHTENGYYYHVFTAHKKLYYGYSMSSMTSTLNAGQSFKKNILETNYTLYFKAR